MRVKLQAVMDRRFFLLSATGVVAAPGAAYAPAPFADAGDPLFASWMSGFIARAVQAGWSRPQLEATFAGVSADPGVIAASTRQPELSKSIGAYLQTAVSDSRVEAGQDHRAEASPWLDPIAVRYAPPPEILVAIWGVESSFGRIQGDLDVVRSLATLSAEGRRQAFAEEELFAALRILFTREASREQLKGSWAGAMGQTQFTPSDYLAYAVDADGDGRRDIWGSSADALASTANFLQQKASWRRGEAWTREVILPAGFDYSLSESVKQPPAAWTALGVRTADGAPFSPALQAEPAALLLPAGWRGPALLAFPNHYAIRVYNNSLSYALAVGLLADRIAGRPPLQTAWPVEAATTRADRLAVQLSLQAKGYDVGEPDGVWGAKTRAAVKLWQRSQGLPADGYLTPPLIEQLKASAPYAAPQPSVPLLPAPTA